MSYYESKRKCIYCDWQSYFDYVETEGIAMVKAHNAEATNEDDLILEDDWEFFFLDEAIREAAKCNDVHTECDECHDFEL